MTRKDGEVRIATIRESVDKIEVQVRSIFENEFINHSVPDRMPLNWCKSKLKVNVPMDMLTNSSFEKILEKLSGLIADRIKLRKEEANLMLSVGIMTIEETVPD